MRKKLTNSKGEFVSEYPGEIGKGFSIGYLEDLCEWTFYRKDKTDEKKLEQILGLEAIIRKMLTDGSLVEYKVNYIPTWSTKLYKKKEKK